MTQQRLSLALGILLIVGSVLAAIIFREAFLGSLPGVFALMVMCGAGSIFLATGRLAARLDQAVAATEEGETRFRDLFDMSPFPGVVTAVKDNTVLAVNQRTADRFGIPQRKAIGLHAPDFYVDPSQRDAVMKQLQKRGAAESALVLLRTDAGEQFWADVSACLVTYKGQQAILTLLHDVTERVVAVEALRASEQRLASENKSLTELTERYTGGSTRFEDRLARILETCGRTLGVERVSMWRFDSERTQIACADLYERGSDRHSAGLAIPRTVYPAYFRALDEVRLIAANDAHRDPRTGEFSQGYLTPLGIGAMLDVPLRQDDTVIGVLCLEHVGGERNWTADEQNFALSVANLIVASVYDADRRAALERLAESEARARLLVDKAHDAFIGITSDGAIAMWNAQAETTFGWTHEQAIGKKLGDLIIPERFRDLHAQGMRRFLETGAAPVVNQRLELSALHQNGREFPIEITITNPIRWETGYFFGAFLRDISERREHEQELRRAKESAEAATRAKSEFLANMSHELRTPLNGVLGYSQLLQRGRTLSSEQREALDAIALCGAHLLDLINDVLDLSKIEAGRIEVELAPMDLQQLTVDVRHVIAEPARRKGIRFSVELDSELPRRIVVDGRHLRQVLLNLLGNAVKFTQDGEIRLTLRAVDGRFFCSVTDTGIGIEEEYLKEIFEAFRQTRAGSSAGGTGLGLTISQRLVTAMGGELSVKSEPGRGSTFHFSLPLVPAEPASTESVPDENIPVLDSRLAPGENLTALVADDSSVNRRILASLLESAGVRVISAEGGVEAVTLSQWHKPDVVLMDLRMRDLDGLEATRQIRANPETASIPVIMVTASAFGDARQAAMEAGCVDFITKPIRAEQLFRKLQLHTKAHFVNSGTPAAPDEESLALPAGEHIADLGRRLVAATAIGSIGEIAEIADELSRGTDTEAALGRRIASLSAAFDFNALTDLAELMQGRPHGAGA